MLRLKRGNAQLLEERDKEREIVLRSAQKAKQNNIPTPPNSSNRGQTVDLSGTSATSFHFFCFSLGPYLYNFSQWVFIFIVIGGVPEKLFKDK